MGDDSIEQEGVRLIEIIKDMRLKFIVQRNVKPRYLIVSPRYECDLFRGFVQQLRPDLSIKESKFMDMEILISRGTGDNIDLAA